MNTTTATTQTAKDTITRAIHQAESPDYVAIKQKQQTAWASGDYAKVGVTLQITGEELCESLDLRAGKTLLDVAAGNGNISLAAARRFCQVTSTDYVESLLDNGRVRADADNLPIQFKQADAEALPFNNSTFDYVVSTFGVMFAPNQQQCASELLRVCTPDGKIGMANWTPDGFIGQLFKTIGQFAAPPKGVNSPSRWGTDDFIQTHFQSAKKIETQEKHFNFRYHSAQHWLDLFRDYYGPIHKAFAAMEKTKAHEFETAILDLINSMNTSGDDTLVLPSEYLEIVITK